MCLDTHAIKRDINLGEKKRLDIDLYSRKNEKVMVNLKTERKDRLVQTLPAFMSKGTIFLTAVNNTDKEWKINRYQMMGSLDCRSLGYFHISRHSLQKIMSDNANFLNDKETVEYFNILMEDHKNVMNLLRKHYYKDKRWKPREIHNQKADRVKVRKISMIVICLKIMTLIHG